MTTEQVLLEKAYDALVWMTGSNDFAPGGQAHKGFVKTVRPVIREISDSLKEEEEMTLNNFNQLPATLESEMLVQAIAIISGQPHFENKSPEEIFDIVAKQTTDVKVMGIGPE